MCTSTDSSFWNEQASEIRGWCSAERALEHALGLGRYTAHSPSPRITW